MSAAALAGPARAAGLAPAFLAWVKDRPKSERVPLPPDVAQVKAGLLRFLDAQRVPNAVVPKPPDSRRGLLLSYRHAPDAEDYAEVFSKSATYDNALALVVYAMEGRDAPAEELAAAARHLIAPNGDVYFTFNTHDDWPRPGRDDGAVVRSGAAAWLGYALAFYAARRSARDPAWAEREAAKVLAPARRIARRLLDLEVRAADDPRRGLVTGGRGSYRFKMVRGKLVEAFVPGDVAWASVEHNIDAYHLFSLLAWMTGEPRYHDAAGRLREALLERAWNPRLKHFYRGLGAGGPDGARALDCASWGSILLSALGERARAGAALDAAGAYAARHGAAEGHRPYLDMLVYESALANQTFFPDAPRRDWNDTPMVWPEGSLGVALARLRLGDRAGALGVLRGLHPLLTTDGALPYATRELRFLFTTAPSTTSAAWYLLVAGALEAPENALFWGKVP